ncbi:DUF6476 family protein [Roseovarius faecimaris]
MMSDNLDPQPVDPGLVKYLRLLVTVLTVTMIAGFLVIVVLFVTKFSDAFGGPDLPGEVVLPEGTEAQAFTRAADWFAIVTTDNRILIYDLDGQLMQEIAVTSAQ